MTSDNSTAHDNDKEHLIASCVLSVFGFLGNIFVIILICREKQNKSTTSYLLLSLALADIVNLLSVDVFAILVYAVHGHGQQIKKVRLITIPAKVAVNFTLGLIALERYNALVKTMKPVIYISKEKIVFGVIIAWVIGLACSVPLVIHTYRRAHTEDPGDKTIFWVMCLFGYILPLIVVTFCYTSILKGLYIDGTILGSSVTDEERMREKKHLVRVLVAITLVFLACNVPAIIMLVLQDNGIDCENKIVELFLSCSSSVINPYIYGLQSEKNRTELKELFCKRRADEIAESSPKVQDTQL